MEWGYTIPLSYLDDVLLASLSRYCMTFQERVYHQLGSSVELAAGTKTVLATLSEKLQRIKEQRE